MAFQQAHDQLKDHASWFFFLIRYCPSMMHIIIPTESTRAPITTPRTPSITPATTTADWSGENEKHHNYILKNLTPSSSGYIPVPLSNEGVTVRDGFACSMVVDLLLEVSVAVGNSLFC